MAGVASLLVVLLMALVITLVATVASSGSMISITTAGC
jgi:hypothetical protein